MSEKISCGTCGRWWTGRRACHCGGCHATFSGISAFDRHSTVHGCIQDFGGILVPIPRAWGTMWATPLREGADPDWWRSRKR